MERTIILKSKEDLMYLAGALCHGNYSTKSYESQTIYLDESTNRCRFNIKFIIPDTSIEEIYKYFTEKEVYT